jgi:Arc/MetJ family transcription regulator
LEPDLLRSGSHAGRHNAPPTERRRPTLHPLSYRRAEDSRVERQPSAGRTTLILDDALFRRAKRRAVERALTLSHVVNAALRAALREPAVAAAPFSMVTFGRPERRVGHEPADFAAAAEDQDLDGLR